jgi:hypothetical protein
MIFWYFVLSCLATFALVLLDPKPISHLEPALGRRIVVVLAILILLPAYLALVLVGSAMEALEKRSIAAGVNELKSYASNLVDGVRRGWNGRH